MLKNVHQYYVYILTNKRNGTLYIGITNSLERRVQEHKEGVMDGFTKKYGLKTLVYFETHQNVNDAITREKRLKKWKRQWKIDMIEKDNPNWSDLANDWYS
ncbi:MAG: GIY-YIG nuclease family protein [Bacteroidota bacterium]|nr:GIY-YIG nuclease family protein [Bacteroidota bacterium]